MTASEARKALRQLHRGGMVWDEIAHQINQLVGRRLVTMDTIRRFVVEERATRAATLYWVERWLESRASSEAAR